MKEKNKIPSGKKREKKKKRVKSPRGIVTITDLGNQRLGFSARAEGVPAGEPSLVENIAVLLSAVGQHCSADGFEGLMDFLKIDDVPEPDGVKSPIVNTVENPPGSGRYVPSDDEEIAEGDDQEAALQTTGDE